MQHQSLWSSLILLAAFVLGLFTGAGSLAYQPQGRINLLLVWGLWAGLPALLWLVGWIFWFWQPRSARQLPASDLLPLWSGLGLQQLSFARFWLWWQWFWLMFAAGLLAVFGWLLVFSDLAFAWSSTLIQDAGLLQRVLAVIALPWSAWWPQAVPSLSLIELTQYNRIQPEVSQVMPFGQWWSFLLASTLCYNLGPRLINVLILLCIIRKSPAAAQWTPTSPTAVIAEVLAPLQTLNRQQLPDNAQFLFWQLTNLERAHFAELGLVLGWHSYQHDEQALAQLVPGDLCCWWVSALHTPTAELSDLIQQARLAGIDKHVLGCVVSQPELPSQAVSWQHFCQQQSLAWLT